jgi:hypothetical protein
MVKVACTATCRAGTRDVTRATAPRAPERAATPLCTAVHTYRGGPTTPGLSTAPLEMRLPATWSSRTRRPAAHRVRPWQCQEVVVVDDI